MSEESIPEEKMPSDTNNNTNGANDGQVCRDYQRGVCNRGGKCKFNHPEGMGTELQSPPMICRDFQNGKCSRSTCKYMHISNTEEKAYLRTGQMPPPMRRFPMGPPMSPPMMRGYPYQQPTRAGRGDPVCKDFLNNKCSRGTGCKFKHTFEEDKGYGSYGGYDDYPRKRRRDSSGESGDYTQLKEENDSLRSQVSDLQKQISDLKATNEVLLEQNARYRNQASTSTSYPATSTYSANYSTKPSTPASSTDYTSYPPRESYSGGAAYTTSGYTNSTTSYTTSSGYGTSSDAYSTTNFASGGTG